MNEIIRPKLSLPARAFSGLASFGLGVTVLSFLLLLTWLGTLEQTQMSLYDVQKKYFDSLFCTYQVGPVKIPLPGVYLLLGILFVNLFCGGIIRIRKNWRNLGIIIAHLSILFIIAAGWVSYHFKTEGHLRLFEGTNSSIFTSYHDRVIEIAEAGGRDPVLMIPEERFDDCSGTRSRTFVNAGLPFEVTVSGYHRNADATTVEMRPPMHGEPVVDRFYLAGRPPEKEAEANLAGCLATIRNRDGTESKALLWEAALAPVTHKVDGRTYTLRLGRQTWELPFDVTLNRFTHAFYPGTQRPRVFESEITKREDGISQEALIEMNKPLRRRGYTLYQASWGPPKWTPDMGRDQLYSVFAVVKNPSDQWPQWALIIAACGIGGHFIYKLATFIRRSTKREAMS
jgi:hypothetical protein